MYRELAVVLKNTIGFKGPLGLKLLDKIGGIFFYLSEYENALLYFKEALSIKENLFFNNVTTIAESLNSVGECYRLLNSYYEAIEILE